MNPIKFIFRKAKDFFFWIFEDIFNDNDRSKPSGGNSSQDTGYLTTTMAAASQVINGGNP